MWKRKAMVVFETMDYKIMDIIMNIPHIPTFQESKDGVPRQQKRTLTHAYSEEDKNLINLDVCARATIINSLPHDILSHPQPTVETSSGEMASWITFIEYREQNTIILHKVQISLLDKYDI